MSTRPAHSCAPCAWVSPSGSTPLYADACHQPAHTARVGGPYPAPAPFRSSVLPSGHLAGSPLIPRAAFLFNTARCLVILDHDIRVWLSAEQADIVRWALEGGRRAWGVA